MQDRRTRNLAPLVAVVLTASASLSSAQAVDVTKVDNHGGTATVQTNAPNSTIAVTALDAGKNPVESWTVTTDAAGKADVKSAYKLSKGLVRARKAGQMPDVVVPQGTVAGEVLMMAVPGTVEGEVVEVETLSGEVVDRRKADKLGRIFLQTGLAAGSYLAVTNGRSSPFSVGGKTVSNGITPRPLGKPLALSTSVGEADLDGLQIRCTGPTQATLPVLAGSKSEVVTDSPVNRGLIPGNYKVEVLDQTGKVLNSQQLTLFEATSRLVQSRIPSGTQTVLQVTIDPPVSGSVTASVLNGPVTFTNHQRVACAAVRSGRATFPVQSAPGSAGKFQLGWEFSPNSPFMFKPDEHGPEQAGKNPDGSVEVTTVEELGEFVEGQPLQRRTKIKNWPDKRSEVTVEIVDKKTGKVLSGTRTTTEHSGKEEKPTKTETWDSEKEEWVEDK